MKSSLVIARIVPVIAASALLCVDARAQSVSPLGGVWTLNRSQSEFPPDIGFNPAWATAAARGDEQRGGASGGSSGGGSGRGRRGGGGGGGGSSTAPAFSARPESYEEARRVPLLTAETRKPPAPLM